MFALLGHEGQAPPEGGGWVESLLGENDFPHCPSSQGGKGLAQDSALRDGDACRFLLGALTGPCYVATLTGALLPSSTELCSE